MIWWSELVKFIESLPFIKFDNDWFIKLNPCQLCSYDIKKDDKIINIRICDYNTSIKYKDLYWEIYDGRNCKKVNIYESEQLLITIRNMFNGMVSR